MLCLVGLGFCCGFFCCFSLGFGFVFFLKEKSFKLTLQTSSRAGLRAGLLSPFWSPTWFSTALALALWEVEFVGLDHWKKAYDTNSLSPNSASVSVCQVIIAGEEKPNPHDTHLVHDWQIYDRTQFPPFVRQGHAIVCPFSRQWTLPAGFGGQEMI